MKYDDPKTTDQLKLTDAVLPGEKHVRQAVTAVSKNHTDDLLVKSDLLNDTFSMLLNAEDSAGVQEQEEQRTGRQKLLRTAANLLLGLAAAGFLFCAWQRIYILPAFCVLLLFVLLRSGIAYLEYRRKQRAWIERMGWAQNTAGTRPKWLLLWIAAGVAGVVLAVSLVLGLAALMRPVETPGPSAAGLDMETFDFRRVMMELGPTNSQVYYDLKSLRVEYLLTENRVYFIAGGTLYSVNADYSDAIAVDSSTYISDSDGSAPEKGEAPVYSMQYVNGSLYYVRHKWDGVKTQHTLIALECGGKLKPRKCYQSSVSFDCFCINPDGSVDLYTYDHGWQQAVAGLDIGIGTLQPDQLITPEKLRSTE